MYMYYKYIYILGVASQNHMYKNVMNLYLSIWIWPSITIPVTHVVP